MFLSCCIVYRCVLLFSFSRCRRHSVCQCLLLGRFFSVRLCSSTCIWGVDLICFVEVLSSCCIKALSLFFILRLRPHILFWGFGLVLYWGFVLIFYFEASASYFIWGFVLIFYFEASASYFILRLRPHILYWGFVLILYFKASSSYFIFRPCSHILFWGFGLVFYFEAFSSYFISRLRPHILYWDFVLMIDLRLRPHCYILRLCSSVWGFGRHCCRPLLLCLYCLFGLFAVMCVVLFVCFLSRVTRCKYYLVWISIHIFNFLCLFFSLHSCNPLFWFTCSYYFSLNFIRLLRVVITPSVTTRNNRMNFRLLLF